MSRQVLQTNLFKKQKKRLHKNQINSLDNAVITIMNDPQTGIQKKGDLKDVWVLKFKMQKKTISIGIFME